MHGSPPRKEIDVRRVAKGPDQRPELAQPAELGCGRDGARDGHSVTAQEGRGLGRRGEVVMVGLPRSGSASVVATGSVDRVGETERGVDSESPCNVLDHR